MRLGIRGLRAQVLLGSVATVFLPILLVGAIAYSALQKHFRELEIMSAEREMLRAQNVLQMRVSDLARTARDYAYWDSMYEFAARQTPEFIRENALPGTVASLGAELWMARAPSGHRLACLFVDRKEARSIPWTLGLEQLFSPSSPFGRVGKEERSGIYLSRDEIWMVAAAPIRRSDKTGEPRGEFVLATRLGSAEASQIQQALHLRAAFLPHRPVRPDGAIDRGDGAWVAFDQATLRCCQALRSPDGTLAGWLVMDLDRPFYQAAASVLGMVVAGLGLLAMLSTAAVALWLRSRVVRRLEELSDYAQSAASHDAPMSLPDVGSDEIGAIGRAISAALQDLAAFRHIVESVPAIVLLFDGHGRCTYANAAAVAFLRFDPSRCGSTWPEIWVREDGSPSDPPESGGTGRAWTLSEPRRLLVFHSARVTLADSPCLLFTGFDGTAQLEAERASELARQALEASPMPVFVLFEDGRIEWANDAARTLVPQEAAFHPGLLGASFEDPFWIRAAASGGPVSVSGTLQGDPSRWLEGSAVRLTTARGPRVIAFLHDVTEIRATFDLLQESERRFRTVIGSLAAGLLVSDREGRVVLANEAVSRLCGESERTSLEDLPIRWSEPVADLLRRVVATGRTIHVDCQADSPAGTLHLQASLFPIGDQIGLLLRDETQRLQAHSALAEALEAAADYRRMFEENPDGVLVVRPDLAIQRCNAAWRELAGLDRCGPDSFVQSFLECDRPIVLRAMRSRAEAPSGSSRFEARLRSPEGALRWVSVVATSLDEPRRILVAVQDVTEARKSEERLLRTLEHHAQLARLFEISPEFHCIADSLGRILTANDAMCAFFGADPVELIGTPIAELLGSEDQRGFEEAMAHMVCCGAALSDYRTRCSAVQGTRTVSWCLAFDAELGLVYASGRDATYQERLRSELEQAASQARALMAGISEAVVATDLTGRVEYWSESAERLFGVRASAARGRRLVDLIADPDDAERFELNFELAKGQSQVGVSVRGTGPDGSARVYEGTLSWFEHDGRRLAVFVLADASERIETQKRLALLSNRLQDLQHALEESGATVWVWRSDAPYEAVWSAGALGTLREGSPHTLGDLVSPLDRDWLLEALQRALAAGEGLLTAEFRVRGDVTRWVHARLALPSKTGTGAIHGVLQDLTDRRQAEEALKGKNAELERLRALLEERNAILAQQSERLGASLQESEAARRRFEAAALRYRRFVDGLPVACVACDAEGTVVEWNRAAEQLFGRRPSEALGQPLASMITQTPLEAHDWNDLHRRALDGESWPAVERPFRRPNGSQGWAVVGAIGLKDLDGEPSGVLFACYDVTHRREEDARREARALQLNELSSRLLETQAEVERLRRLLGDRADRAGEGDQAA